MHLMLWTLGVVVAADQATKAVVIARLAEGKPTLRNICGARLRHVVNRRNPWGSKGAVRVMTIVWVSLAAAACIVASRIDSPAAQVALGALLGGATGNLIDGVSRNGVTDFIDLRVWPVFNLADAAIVAGAVLFLWNMSDVLKTWPTV